MSVNIQTTTGLKLLADKTTKINIEKALGYTPANNTDLSKYLLKDAAANNYLLKGDAEGIYATLDNLSNYLAKEDDGDSFSISDSAGNIILRVDKDGVHSVDFTVEGKSILEIIEDAGFSGDYNDLTNKPNIKEDESNTLYITDEVGNIVAKIDAEGLHAYNVFIGREDKEVAIQEDLVDLSNTISENISTAIQKLNKDVEELVNTKSDVNHSHNDLISDSNEFAIADNKGNMIMKVDQAGVHSTAFYVDGKSIAEIGFSGNYNDLTNKPDFNGLSSTVNSLSESVNSVIDEVDILDDSVTLLQEADTNLSTQIRSLDSNKSNINHSHDNLTSDSVDFSITDNDGNIIATINQDGLNTVNLMLDGIDFSTKIDSKFETILDDLRNEFSENDRLKLSLIPFGLNIPENADLNTVEYLSVGSYFCSQNAIVSTFRNCPTTQAFLMQVYSPISKSIDNEATGTWVYRLRKLMSYQGDEYIQYISTSGTAGEFTYGEWKKITTSKDIANMATKTDIANMATKTDISDMATKTWANGQFMSKSKITYSKTDLTAGSSKLTTGNIYIVYE